MRLATLRGLLPQRADWSTLRRPGRDLLAGVIVAVVALPLALGFGIASGLGAAAGLTTAIVAGALAAIFGGSDYQVSGPTGAMTVILVPIVAKYGPGGVLTVGFLAGIILLALAVARAGRFIRYVPVPVVEGFTAGIAAVIFLQQVPTALGVDAHSDRVTVAAWQAFVDFVRHPHWTSILLAIGVAATMLIAGRWRPTVPFSLIAVIGATLVAVLFKLPVATIGELPATLPAPSLDFLHLSAVPTLATSAIAVAALAALESLLSATVADSMAQGRRHDPDRELFGQGIANLATPLFGGVPATAAIARTAVNVRSGARSRLAALTHAAVLALIMLVATPLVAHIPLAALAGVLLATAIRMVEVSSMTALANASRSDALVMALTAAATIILDLVSAVLIGLVVAGALTLRRIALSVRLTRVPVDGYPEVVAYELDGPLFFAAAHRSLRELSAEHGTRVVLLGMSRISSIDSSGALALRETVDHLRQHGVWVALTAVRPAHRRILETLGVLDGIDVFPDVPSALAAAPTRVCVG